MTTIRGGPVLFGISSEFCTLNFHWNAIASIGISYRENQGSNSGTCNCVIKVYTSLNIKYLMSVSMASISQPWVPPSPKLCAKPTEILCVCLYLCLLGILKLYLSASTSINTSCYRSSHQELVPGAMLALKDLLCGWNGEDFSQLIFRLLRYLPLMDFMGG